MAGAVRSGLLAIAFLVAVLGAAFAITPSKIWNAGVDGRGRTGLQAFASWLDKSRVQKRRFAEFEDFLDSEGVANIVPAWQLTRADTFQGSKCVSEPFLIPPRESWKKIVPALRLVETEVKPRLGEVEVVSTFRSPDVNRCAGGAGRSRHLRFEALDLRIEADLPRQDIFAELCDMWRIAGPRSGMGLGAYYDPEDPEYNRKGRFHIDAGGYRTWGRTYSRDSSPCV